MRLVPMLEDGDLELLRGGFPQNPCNKCDGLGCNTCTAYPIYLDKRKEFSDHKLVTLAAKLELARQWKAEMARVQRKYQEVLDDLPQEVRSLV